MQDEVQCLAAVFFPPAEKDHLPGDSLLFKTAKSRTADKQTTTKLEEPKLVEKFILFGERLAVNKVVHHEF